MKEPGPAAAFVPASQLLGSSCSKQDLELAVKDQFNERLVDLTEGVTGTCSSSGATEGTEGGLEDRSQKSGLAASSSGFSSASQLISSCSKISSSMEHEAVYSRGPMSYAAPTSSLGGSLSIALKGKGPSKPKSSKLDSAVKQTPKLTDFFQKQVPPRAPQPSQSLASPRAAKDSSNSGEISSGGKAMQVCI